MSLLGITAFFYTINDFNLLLLNIAIFSIANGLTMPYVDTIAFRKIRKITVKADFGDHLVL